MGFPRWCSGKEFTCQCRRLKRRGFDPWVWKIPWTRKWQPIPIFLPGKFHRQKSLVGYSPWVPKLDMIEYTHTHTHTHTRACIHIFYRRHLIRVPNLSRCFGSSFSYPGPTSSHPGSTSSQAPKCHWEGQCWRGRGTFQGHTLNLRFFLVRSLSCV